MTELSAVTCDIAKLQYKIGSNQVQTLQIPTSYPFHWQRRLTALLANVPLFPRLMQGASCCLRSSFFLLLLVFASQKIIHRV